MNNGIGLHTPRGSGTNGYVQSNKFFARPKTNKVIADSSKGFESDQGTAGVSRNPNKEIWEHNRKRQIHVKLVGLADKLIDEGYTNAEKFVEARKALEAMDVEDEGNAGDCTEKFSDTDPLDRRLLHRRRGIWRRLKLLLA